MGGSGKTPVVAALARLLHASGHRPAILSRGYARRRISEGVLVVSDGSAVGAPVEESGDEPQMLARQLRGVPVLVCHDRYLAGRLAERRFDASIMLLDDGFQHLQLQRSVDLLVVSRQDLSERLLPSGLLREPLTAARSADAVLVYGTADEAAHVAGVLGVATAFAVVPRYGALRRLGTHEAVTDGARVVAVAGIARPQRFFTALGERGFDVARALTFRDHHWFSAKDIAGISGVAHEVGATAIVTTEKDGVRLEALVPAARIPWALFPMDVTIEPADEFLAWLGPRV